MSIPTVTDGEVCPNCGKSGLTGNNWCQSCGYNKHNITFVGPPLKYPFSFLWFLFAFLIIPLAACGGCIFGVSIPNGSQDSFVNALFVQVGSVLAGICLLIYNGVKGQS